MHWSNQRAHDTKVSHVTRLWVVPDATCQLYERPTVEMEHPGRVKSCRLVTSEPLDRCIYWSRSILVTFKSWSHPKNNSAACIHSQSDNSYPLLQVSTTEASMHPIPSSSRGRVPIQFKVVTVSTSRIFLSSLSPFPSSRLCDSFSTAMPSYTGLHLLHRYQCFSTVPSVAICVLLPYKAVPEMTCSHLGADDNRGSFRMAQLWRVNRFF